MEKDESRLERRRHKRYEIREKTYAIPDYESIILGHVKDISLGGLSFHYMFSTERPMDSFDMTIYVSGIGEVLNRVRVKIVSDIEVDDEVPYRYLKTRRCGVQFEELTPINQSKLQYLINNCTNP